MSTPKVVLITGATGGLGSFLTRIFWENGFSLILVARDGYKLAQLSAILEKRGSQECVIQVCDLSKLNEVMYLMAKIKSEMRQIDVLINNAAIHGPIGVASPKSILNWTEAINVNLIAPAILSSGLAEIMSTNGGGVIINLSGGGATSPRPNFTCYASTKAALVRFTETLSEEWRGRRIRANCVSPGIMPTAILQEIIAYGRGACGDKEFEIASTALLNDKQVMNEVAELILFLSSDDSDGITGKLISATWDNWRDWKNHIDDLNSKDVYTLRRIIGRDRNQIWGDND